MAGKLRNRSIPSSLERDMAAALAGQLHVCCTCHATGKGPVRYAPDYAPPRCDECNVPMMPMWDVIDSRGHVKGQVAGPDHQEALESVRQAPQYDSLKSFTVSPATTDRSPPTADEIARGAFFENQYAAWVRMGRKTCPACGYPMRPAPKGPGADYPGYVGYYPCRCRAEQRR